MLSFRQTDLTIWLYSGFVVAGALALNLRYKPVAGESGYLDTWTGRMVEVAAETRSATAMNLLPSPLTLEGSDTAPWEEHFLLRQSGDCRGVRFAFPAPGTSFR